MEEIFKSLDKISDIYLRFDMFKEILEEIDIETKHTIVKQYIQYEKKKIAINLAEKNRLTNTNDIENANRCKINIKRIKRYIKMLKDFSISKEKIFNKDIALKLIDNSFCLTAKRVELFDKYCNTNLMASFNSLEQEEVSITVLEDMKKQCLDSQELLKNQYKKAHKNKDQKLLEEVIFHRRTKGLLLNYINHYISSYNHRLKQEQKIEETYEDVFGKEEVFTKKQIALIESIVNDYKMKVNNLTDLITALKAVIKNYRFKEVCESIWAILEIISSIEIEPALRELYYLSIIDTLKDAKKNQYSKKDLTDTEKLEKREMIEMIKMLQNNILILDQSFFDDEECLDYQIIQYFINNIIPYYYLKKIITSKPELLTLKHNEESLAVLTVKKCIESQETELINQEKDYIPKEYYKNLYLLIMDCTKGSLSPNDQEEISNLISNYEEYLNKSNYKKENINNAKRLLHQLKCNYQTKCSKTDIDIEEIKTNLKELTKYLINSQKRVMLEESYHKKVRQKIYKYQEEFYKKYQCYASDSLVCQELQIPMYDFMNAIYMCSTVSFANNHISYSLLQDGKGTSYLRMNVLDLSSYIQEGDILERYLLENIDQKFKNRFNYNKECLVPSITYQIKIFPNGSIGNLKIYPSVAKISKKYDSLENYRQDPVLKSYIATYKKIIGDCQVPETTQELDNFFRDFITNLILKFTKTTDIPIILYGKSFPDEERLMHIQNDLSPIFSKMERQQFKFYSNILRDSLDESHYVNQDFDTGTYTLKLENPINYVDLFNQRMLLSCEKILSNETYHEQYKETSNRIVAEVNSRLGYVKEEPIKSKRKKYNR